MAFEKIEAAVLSEAKAKAEALLARVRGEAGRSLAAARERFRGEHEARLAAFKAQLAEERARKLSALRGAEGIGLLRLKNEIVERVFGMATERLGRLPREEVLAALGRRLADHGGGGEILANARERGFIDGPFLAALNKDRAPGDKLSLSPETDERCGGIVLRAGKVEHDWTWETALADMKGDLTSRIAEELFG